ncbi:ATP-dependent Clp protease proteolytic subunit [Massilia haematophila]|uniref:ATP-dependent Clp protease proteolytic subunit n=1 Tax=Massilia haematophila TaxID=457923 RepID=A0ABV7PSN0_9BURK
MTLHIVHFIGPINHSSACAVRNLCLQALQSGASEIELHMSTEGGNMTAGFALYFFLKSLPIPLTTFNIGSVESVGVVIFLAGQKRYACPGARFLVHPLHWGFGSLVAADHARVSEWRDCLDFDAERYAAIFDEATRGAPEAVDIRPPTSSATRASIRPSRPCARASSTKPSRPACPPWAPRRIGGTEHTCAKLATVTVL